MKIFILVFCIFLTVNAYETEDKIKVAVISKIAKYIANESSTDKNSKNYTITVLKNSFGSLFDQVYKNKTINSKPINVVYINRIEHLRDTDILFISKVNQSELSKILKEVRFKNILTISDNRAFAQKGGLIQLYFVSQKLKIKINMANANSHNLKIRPALLRIAELVKGEI